MGTKIFHVSFRLVFRKDSDALTTTSLKHTFRILRNMVWVQFTKKFYFAFLKRQLWADSKINNLHKNNKQLCNVFVSNSAMRGFFFGGGGILIWKTCGPSEIKIQHDKDVVRCIIIRLYKKKCLIWHKKFKNRKHQLSFSYIHIF